MAEHNETGKWGEEVAAEFLEQQGYNILERNWRIDHKEIDIIATDGRRMLFVEVKTRRNAIYGSPIESVDRKKSRNLLTAMRRYMAINRLYMPTRFDVVTVTGTPESHKVELIENAVSNFNY